MKLKRGQLLEGTGEPTNPILFNGLNADIILQGFWFGCTSMVTHVLFIQISLNQSIYRIATTLIHPEGLSALVACRLIPLNKCPGVRPIGVGENCKCIIVKAVLRIVSKDVEAAADPLQVRAGQDGRCEAAVHAMCKIFKIQVPKLFF